MATTKDIVFDGQIIEISPIKQGPTWQAQQMVIKEINTQYPKTIAFDLLNKDIDKYATLQVGNYISVHINVDCRKYNDRYYANLKAWKIDIIDTTGTSAPELEMEDETPPF